MTILDPDLEEARDLRTSALIGAAAGAVAALVISIILSIAFLFLPAKLVLGILGGVLLGGLAFAAIILIDEFF